MDEKSLTVDIDELMKFYRSLPPEASLPLRVTGNSMSPFLADGRDTVYLSKTDRKLRIGDIVLYQRENGAYILHRICRIRDGIYTMIGDAHSVREEGIRREQIFALVTSVKRKGKILKPGNGLWEFFAEVWIRVIPARPVLRRIYGAVRRVVR